ncbi:PREDICTED: uncharacterized protein LOC104760131 isoform X2 [Camelina sativa]|uniref:Uncharacterized protein LOC104760131 isoform X2 n=1 Tax=Camelina sativa TaxID=90675 RepID=A0ABM0X642_CAMSA|nr:PREDICTED: uncharacterized protein LOC104760131 isoform X2 [Camelina sativa]
MDRYNPLQPFPIDSLESLLMETTNSGALDEETLESAFWDCCVCSCDPPSQCFESFVTHLSDEDHLEELMLVTRTPPPTPLEDCPLENLGNVKLVRLENPPFSRCHKDKLSKLLTISVPLQHLSAPLSEAPQINMDAVTLVFWDIKMCPVPRGCHPRRVGPPIKLFLKNKGYSGHLTITAIGVLKDVPNDVLEGVYSGGVSLNNIFTGQLQKKKWLLSFTLKM